MHCSNCGKDSEDGTRVCPWCGTRMSPVANPRPKRKATVATVAVLAIAVVACFAIFAMENEPDDKAVHLYPEIPRNDVPDDSDIPGDSEVRKDDAGDRTISYTSDHLDIFDISYGTSDDGKTQIIVSMKDEEASEYTSFTWYVNKNISSGNYRVGNVTKTTDQNEDANRVTWTLEDSDIGTYTIGVICSQGTGWGGLFDFGPLIPWNQKSYTLKVTIDGDIAKTYSWKYDGSDYTFTINYAYSEYEKYAGSSGASMEKREAYNDGRGNVDFDVVTDFIVVNDVVDDIQNALKKAYESSGKTATGQDYAEFILAFVQECYGYMYDEVQYLQDEYFAFPMETIHNGNGDCEDTSILLAAIYESAGFDTGVFLIPGHAIAAVALNPYVAGDYDKTQNVSVFSIVQDGKTYYGCETTLDENIYGVGYITNTYTVEDNSICYNGKKVSDISEEYGLYRVAA